MTKDEGCPTCGSKNFGDLGMSKKSGMIIWKKQCYNCKKFWYASLIK